MGLAPYGVPRYKDLILSEIVDVKESASGLGGIALTENYKNLIDRLANPGILLLNVRGDAAVRALNILSLDDEINFAMMWPVAISPGAADHVHFLTDDMDVNDVKVGKTSSNILTTEFSRLSQGAIEIKAAAALNTSAKYFQILCFRDIPLVCAPGAYDGDASAEQNITTIDGAIAIGFDPQAAIALDSDSNSNDVSLGGDGFAATRSRAFASSGASQTNGVRDMITGGFEAGSSINVNGNRNQFVALRTGIGRGCRVDIQNRAGSAAGGNRDIDISFNPNILLITNVTSTSTRDIAIMTKSMFENRYLSASDETPSTDQNGFRGFIKDGFRLVKNNTHLDTDGDTHLDIAIQCPEIWVA